MPAAELAKTQTKSDTKSLAEAVEQAFERRDEIGPTTAGAVREAVEDALDLLDRGEARVAEKAADGSWRVNQWLKKAVLLSFRLNDMSVIPGGPGRAVWWDKVAVEIRRLGRQAIFALPDFARCLAASYGVLPISRPASC